MGGSRRTKSSSDKGKRLLSVDMLDCDKMPEDATLQTISSSESSSSDKMNDWEDTVDDERDLGDTMSNDEVVETEVKVGDDGPLDIDVDMVVAVKKLTGCNEASPFSNYAVIGFCK